MLITKAQNENGKRLAPGKPEVHVIPDADKDD